MRCTMLALSLFILAACGAQEPAATPAARGPDVTGAIWKWTGVEGGAPASVRWPGRYTLEFLADGRYSVRADCNSGSGTWSSAAGGISMKGGPMTLVACGDDTHDARFLELLSQVRGARRDGDRLTLVAGEASMQFVAMEAIQLAGTGWLVHAFNNGRGGVVTVLEDSELTVAFGDDGRVAGSAGCNQFNGGFHTAAQTVSFTPLATTRKMCMGDGIDDQEQKFLAALATAATWEVRGERLQLRSADGSLAVDLVSAVTGTAMIRTRQALPPDAEFAVQLLDVSRADAPAAVLGETSRPLEGRNSPFAFVVPFDHADVDARMSFSLRATIHSAGELLFVTTEHYPVLTGEGGQFGVDLLLDPVER